MRIRKNARRVVDKDTPLRTSFIVCKLNRSPWDDDSFYSQLFEDESNDNFPFTRSSTDSTLISDSDTIVESPMELIFEYIEKQLPQSPPRSPKKLLGEENQPIVAKSIQPVLIDLESPPRRASDKPKEDYHLFSQPRLKRSIYPNVKYSCPSQPKKRTARPLLPTSVPSTPQKHGPPKKHTLATRGKLSANTATTNNGTTSSNGKVKRQIIIEDDIVIHGEKKYDNNNNVVSVVENLANKEIVYIDNDDDDDDNKDYDGDKIIRKRPRKLIKAKLLKYLM